jgi:hypothetical protein
MENSLLLITFFFIFGRSSGSVVEEFMKKYCDPSITDSKIDELEKCESSVALEEV